MTDQNTFDLFEQRIASGLERYVASAVDARPAAEIADEAMRPRGVGQRLRHAPRSRRMLFFALAAVLLIPAALVGAGTLLRWQQDPVENVLLPGPTIVPTFVAHATPLPTPLLDETRAIMVRRTPGSNDGVSIYAVRPDGAERLLRQVPDSILPTGNSFSEYGSVSSSGWIALAEARQPWNMVLVDLRDPESEPRLVTPSNLGAVSVAWGPQGLLAVPLGTSGVLIIDPESQEQLPTLAGGMIGGGPTIFWAEDGSGVVDQREGDVYGVLPIDGSPFRTGFPDVFEARGGYGDRGANLRVCSSDEACEDGVEDGSVELVSLDGTATTIYEPTDEERTTSAVFGQSDGEYLVQVGTDAGRRIAVDRVSNGEVERIRTLPRTQAWRHAGLWAVSDDESLMTFFVDLGNDTYGIALVPADRAPTYHQAAFAGFLASSIADSAGDATYDGELATPIGAAADQPYPMPSIDELIAAEVDLNPGHTPVGQASHDAVETDSEVNEYEVVTAAGGDIDVYLDCYGATEVTVTFNGTTLTNPCNGGGSYSNTFINMTAGDAATLTASHDTSWRVVLYTYTGDPGDTPAPVPN